MFVEILLDLDHNHVASLSEFLFRWFSVRCIFNKKIIATWSHHYYLVKISVHIYLNFVLTSPLEPCCIFLRIPLHLGFQFVAFWSNYCCILITISLPLGHSVASSPNHGLSWFLVFSSWSKSHCLTPRSESRCIFLRISLYLGFWLVAFWFKYCCILITISCSWSFCCIFPESCVILVFGLLPLDQNLIESCILIQICGKNHHVNRTLVVKTCCERKINV